MYLSEHIRIENILIKSKSRDRWDLIEKMLSRAVANNEIRKTDEETIKNHLIDREKSMSTGIGRGIAIPHCTTSKVDTAVIELATMEKGIEFESIDGIPVRIAVLLIVPKNKFTHHINTLANIARTMANEQLREELIKSDTAEQIINILKQYDTDSKK
jgi:mannitol/fructose-specific phosphotransferase system IIA component (Ntr-type)